MADLIIIKILTNFANALVKDKQFSLSNLFFVFIDIRFITVPPSELNC